jgi:hypothetical protein
MLAMVAFHKIVKTEIGYKATHGRYASLKELLSLPEHSDMRRRVFSAREGRYAIAVMVAGDSFQVLATPRYEAAEAKSLGLRSLYSDQTGVVRFEFSPLLANADSRVLGSP